MGRLPLIPQREEAVRADLETGLAEMRRVNYHFPRDYGGFVRELSRATYREFWEGNHPLLEGLEQGAREQQMVPTYLADFCCGSGKGTLKIAELFPEVEVYGFDDIQKYIAKAKKRARGERNSRVHFLERDVYRFRWGTRAFDVVTFHKACGTLADKVIQYGTEHDVPMIAGKGCCHETISPTPSRSQNLLCNWYVRKMNQNYDANINAPRQGVDCDLLSNFARDSLGMTEQELERIAATAIDVQLGARIVDLNRVMKLIERGYVVSYNETNHIVVARRKNPALE
ncbi:methyltransferase domain-containing protein [Candidatus Woesearchaeota archaeon]|nr:methyltransferase domain-containing protein [Candidatus Woesearchaeota archaeon]